MLYRVSAALAILGAALPPAARADDRPGSEADGAAAELVYRNYASTLVDVELRPEVGTGIYGEHLTGNLGISSLGVQELAGRWLVSWDGQAELVVGGVAYEHPYFPVYGAQGEAHGEGGLRLMPTRAFSPYVSAGADVSLSAVTEFGVPFNGGTSINNLDGFGGIIGTADARLGVGASYLRPRHSLIIELQPLAEIDSAQSNLSVLGFLGGALHLRYDWRDRLTAIGEASFVVTPGAQTDAALGTSSVAGHWTLAANAVRKFGSHFFGGLGLSVSRSATELTYAAGQVYSTVSPVDSRMWLLFGYWP